MRKRHRARELALQFLYQIDSGGEGLETALDKFRAAFQPPPETFDFFYRLVKGVSENRDQLDRLIQAKSHHWKIGRMSNVDRNILRLAAFEITSCPDIPEKVSINEAVELAKSFGTVESSAFINGILDSISKKDKQPINRRVSSE